MDLWQIFPESVLHIPGILNLPYLSLVLYVVLVVIAITYQELRTGLVVFLLTSFFVSVYFVLSIRFGVGKFLPPLLLLAIILLPLMTLCFSIVKRDQKKFSVWFLALLTGVTFALNWFIWTLVLTGS